MSIIHVHKLNFILLVDIIELGVRVYSSRETLVHTERQIFPAVNTHKHDIFVAGVAWLHLKGFHKFMVYIMTWHVELQKNCVFIFVVQIIENLIFSVKLFYFIVL